VKASRGKRRPDEIGLHGGLGAVKRKEAASKLGDKLIPHVETLKS